MEFSICTNKISTIVQRIVEGQPRLSVNLESAARNASEVHPDINSICTALVVQQINKQA